MFSIAPKLASLRKFFETLELYIEKVAPALAPFVEPRGLGLVFMAGLAWLSAFAALGAFTRLHDGVSLWQHIGSNNCWRLAEASGRAFWCTLPKWLATLALAPALIVTAFVKRIAVGVQTVTVGYVTFDPSVIATYFKHVGMAAVAFVSIAATLGYVSPPVQHTVPQQSRVGSLR